MVMHRRLFSLFIGAAWLIGAQAQNQPTMTCGAHGGLLQGGAGMTQTSADPAGPNQLWVASNSGAAAYPTVTTSTPGYGSESCVAATGSTAAEISACVGITITGTDYTGGSYPGGGTFVPGATDRRTSCESTTDPCEYVPEGSRDRHPTTGWPYTALPIHEPADLLDGDGAGDTLANGRMTVEAYVCSNYQTW